MIVDAEVESQNVSKILDTSVMSKKAEPFKTGTTLKPKVEAKIVPKAVTKQVFKVEPKPEVKPLPKVEPKPEVKPLVKAEAKPFPKQ